MPLPKHCHEASLEVLTDGSELTGGAAIFLTIRRGSTSIDISPITAAMGDETTATKLNDAIHYKAKDENGKEGTILARYNLTGLPSLTGRLSTDQSYKLLSGGGFKCVLLPSLVSSPYDCYCEGEIRGASVGGLAALFLSLIQNGYKVAKPTLTVSSVPAKSADDNNEGKDSSDSVLDGDGEENNQYNQRTAGSCNYSDISIIGPQGTDRTVDGMMDTMFGHGSNRPSLRVCDVPAPKSDNDGEADGCWWGVYQDTHVRIWGQSVDMSVASSCVCERCATSLKKRRRDEMDGESSPSSSSNGEDEDSESEAEDCDDVHSSNTSTRVSSVVYIVMIHQLNGENESQLCRPYSFAIVPPPSALHRTCQSCKCRFKCNNPCWKVFRNLPQEVAGGNSNCAVETQQHLLDFILHLSPDSVDAHCDDGFSSNGDNPNHNSVPQHRIKVPPWVIAANLARHHLATIPDGRKNNLDPGILVRAQQRSKYLTSYLPFAFPLNGCDKVAGKDDTTQEATTAKNSYDQAIAFGLESCTSVLLRRSGGISGNVGNVDGSSDNQITELRHPSSSFTFLSRVKSILSRCKRNDDVSSSVIPEDKSNMISSLRDAYQTKRLININPVVNDDNEIDLDVSDDESNVKAQQHDGRGTGANGRITHIDRSSPHLLVLGTGCATPSPHRGSSAYAIFMPTSYLEQDTLALSAIIECGEGTLTSLLRHLPSLPTDATSSTASSFDEHLRSVQFVWVSHSHLDHYGDLPSVVQAIANAKKRRQTLSTNGNPLVVIAPSKVLQFLNVVMNGSTEKSLKERSYVGITHREFQYSPFADHVRSMIYGCSLDTPICLQQPIQTNDNSHTQCYHPFFSLRNVEVEHCREAFALILEVSYPINDGNSDRSRPFAKQKTFVLCFSGDTRPSNNLVHECRCLPPQPHRVNWQQMQFLSLPPPPPPPRISLLLHEATFLGDLSGQADAVKKRHSTSTEALDIARLARAEACLLTHFSQRYAHLSLDDITATSNEQTSGSYEFSWGVALDGMLLPLTKRGTSSLSQLSQCIDALLTNISE